MDLLLLQLAVCFDGNMGCIVQQFKCVTEKFAKPSSIKLPIKRSQPMLEVIKKAGIGKSMLQLAGTNKRTSKFGNGSGNLVFFQSSRGWSAVYPSENP